MSKLEELIRTLCPDGVIYKPVKDVYRRLKGTSITAGKMKEIEDSEGDIKVFAGGKTVINTNEEDIPNANIIKTPAVLVQSRGIIDVIYYDKPFTFKNEMWAYTDDDVASVKFLYYVLKNNIQKFRDAASGMGSMPQISLPVTEEFMMPVPPLEVQREIVRILDNFTERTEELTEKLTEELTARKQQYEYYKREILKLENVKTVKSLREIASFKNGKGHEKNIELNGKYIVVNSKFISTDGNIKKYSDKQLCPLFKNDILIVMSDLPNGKALAKCFLVDEDDKYTLNQRIGALHSLNEQEVSTKFLFYILNRNNQLLKYDNGTDQTNLKKDDILNILISIPPIHVQNQIVAILDKFELICNDISDGIPAEIEARHKQYEYYRDRLLKFKEKIA